MPNMIKVNYSLTAYKNTGFNGFDIPATPDVLEEAEKTVYNDTYYLREDFDKPIIQVNDNYHNLSDVDYVKLHANTMVNNQPTDVFFFCSPKALAGGTTALSLELDALMTLGGAENLDYTSGWQVRGHIPKEEDTLFGNIASEEWSPKNILITKNYTKLTPYNNQAPSEDLHIILTNIDLGKLLIEDDTNGEYVDVYKGVVDESGSLTEKMYIPKLFVNQTPSVFRCNPGLIVADRKDLVIPSIRAYDGDDSDVIEAIQKLYSFGQLQLQNSYTIPKEYIVAPTKLEDGSYGTLTGWEQENGLNELPFIYSIPNYTVKNMKCFSTFRMFTLMNPASGGTIVKPVQELQNVNHGNTAPFVRLWADPVSTGKPYARFLTDEIPENIVYLDTVEGAQWNNAQIVMEGASGSVWNSLNASMAQQGFARDTYQTEMQREVSYNQQDRLIQMAERNAATQGLNQLLGIGGNIAGAVGSGLGGNLGGVVNGVAQAASAAIGFEDFALNTVATINNMEDQRDLTNNMAALQQDRITQQINESKIGEIRNNNVVAPTQIFTASPNAAMYGLNKFYVYETRKTDEDLIAEDMYYQMYGYNGLNKKLTADCFKARQYYNFVQAFNINLKSDRSTSMRLKMKAISQLNGGVRVWKVLPDASYFDIN